MKVGDIVQATFDPQAIGVVDKIVAHPSGNYVEVTYITHNGVPTTMHAPDSLWNIYNPPTNSFSAPFLDPFNDAHIETWGIQSSHTCTFKSYVGLTESYQYCTICDKKVT